MLVIGYEIGPIDIEKLKIYETITIKEEIPEKEYNSCDHLDDQAYEDRIPNYCSECGVRVMKKKQKRQPPEYKRMLTKYKDEFYTGCGCLNCKGCTGCSCEACLKYFDIFCRTCKNRKEDCECQYIRRYGYIDHTTDKIVSLTTPANYKLMECNCNYTNCNCLERNLGYGFYIKNGYKLIHIDGHGYYIIFDKFRVCDSIELDEEKLVDFTAGVRELLSKYKMSGRLQLLYIR